MTTFSKRGTTDKVVGNFFVTYKAQRRGRIYQTVHLSPSYSKAPISADELNAKWQAAYSGKCPFNGDSNFEVVMFQQQY